MTPSRRCASPSSAPGTVGREVVRPSRRPGATCALATACRARARRASPSATSDRRRRAASPARAPDRRAGPPRRRPGRRRDRRADGRRGAGADADRGRARRRQAVVTANKYVIARHGAELEAIARRTGAPLRFEAAVGGGMPVLGAARDDLAANRSSRSAGSSTARRTSSSPRWHEAGPGLRGRPRRRPGGRLRRGRPDRRRRGRSTPRTSS